MDGLVSVIIPVYKTEKYLDHCISSVVNQSYKNLQIILVDDGSPDRCGAICDRWAEIDSRIVVCHRQNFGAGASRNAGMKIAEGDFIQFVDSDDYISPFMTEFLIQHLKEGADIAECEWRPSKNVDLVFDNVDSPYLSKEYNCTDAMRENIKDHIFRQVIWNKIYRKEVVSGIEFPEGHKIDDEYWTYQVIGNADHLVYTDKVLYAYRQQDHSVMHTADYRKAIEGVEAKALRHQYICEKMPVLEKESLLSLWNMMLFQGQQALKMDPESKRIILEFIKTQRKHYPADFGDYPLILKQKVWIKAAEKCFLPVCGIRNMLKIGC